jgi:hypothetical protein
MKPPISSQIYDWKNKEGSVRDRTVELLHILVPD